MNQEKIRTFIAVSLPQAIIEKIEIIQNKLKRTEADIRWVKRGDIHLTLKFLGDITPAELAKLEDEMGKIAQSFPPFPITIAGLGAFPSLERPRVIWIGISRGGEILKEINKVIEDNLSKVGFPREERLFHPHLTLGRVRSSRYKSELIKEIKDKPVSIGDMSIEKISIYQSVLTSEGPIYTILLTIAFLKDNHR